MINTQPQTARTRRRRVKRLTRRNIVVDGVAYTWKCGDWLEIRRDGKTIFRKSLPEIIGTTWNDFDRGKHKGWAWAITPANVAKLIRKVTK